MKKVLAVLMTLILAVTLCVPSFAADESTTSTTDNITAIIEQIIGQLTGGSSGSVDVDAVLDALEGFLGTLQPDVTIPDINAPIANSVVNTLLAAGMTKADLDATFNQMYTDGQITETTYNLLMAALDAAPDDGSQNPVIDDSQASEVAGQIISALQSLGVTTDQMIDAVDSLYERGVLPENVYNAIIEQINAAEGTTAADTGAGGLLGGLLGGVGDFFGGIFDTIGGLLGFGGGDDSGDNTTAPNATDDSGVKAPTGDTAVFAVVGVAAVAGAALLLTRKKKSDK